VRFWWSHPRPRLRGPRPGLPGRSVPALLAIHHVQLGLEPGPLADRQRRLGCIAEGRFDDAIREAARAEHDDLNGPAARIVAGRAAIQLRDLGRAEAALRSLDVSGWRGAALGLHRDALAAGVAALDGRWGEAAPAFADAWRRYRELRLDVSLAVSALDCLAVAPPGEPLAEMAAREARAILEREGATAYFVQLERLLADRAASGSAAGDRRRAAARNDDRAAMTS